MHIKHATIKVCRYRIMTPDGILFDRALLTCPGFLRRMRAIVTAKKPVGTV
jgi:hypothetical protein